MTCEGDPGATVYSFANVFATCFSYLRREILKWLYSRTATAKECVSMFLYMHCGGGLHHMWVQWNEFVSLHIHFRATNFYLHFFLATKYVFILICAICLRLIIYAAHGSHTCCNSRYMQWCEWVQFYVHGICNVIYSYLRRLSSDA